MLNKTSEALISKGGRKGCIFLWTVNFIIQSHAEAARGIDERLSAKERSQFTLFIQVKLRLVG